MLQEIKGNNNHTIIYWALHLHYVLDMYNVI